MTVTAAWDEALHPRAPAGDPTGGQFAPPSEAQEKKQKNDKDGKGAGRQFAGPDMSYDPKKNRGTGYGRKGGDRRVRVLQRALNRLGLTDAKGKKLAVDGQLGPLTTQAVKDAQRKLGMKADGVVTAKFLEKLASTKSMPKAKPKPKAAAPKKAASADALVTFGDDGHPVVPNVLWDWRESLARERDVNLPGGGDGHNLREYWVRGEGAAKIGWGTDGSFARCVTQLSEYVKDPEGLCAEYHKAATGEWPAEEGVPSEGDVESLTENPDVVAAVDEKCPPGHHKMEDGECMPDEEMTEEYAVETEETVSVTAPWSGVLTVEGIESGDGRMFAAQSLSWDEPPLPLMWQKETSHGGDHDVTVRVGSIERIWREPSPSGQVDVFYIRGEGVIDLENEDGAEVHRRMDAKHLRGNSVDVDSVKEADVELSFPEVAVTPAEGGVAELATSMFSAPELTTFHRGRIRATTLCEIPAFTEARLELVDALVASTAVLEREDVDEQESRVIPLVRRRLDALTAATSVIEIADLPPREWFDEPTDVAPLGALTVTNEGRIYGFIAPAGVRHRSFARKSQYVPLQNVDYQRFMGGETIVADGSRVATGAITMDCGHATTAVRLSGAQAQEHYDNSCSIVATARVGESEHGVWVAGALLPDVSAGQVRRIMACRLSGDWRSHLDRPGWREFVAALLVPVPGFPMARTAPSVQVNDGQLVAASVPVRLEVDSRAGERRARVSAALTRVRVAAARGRVASLGSRSVRS